MKAAHGKSMTKIQKASEKLAAQLKEKQAENDRLERRRREMEESVAMRQSILDTRAAGKAGAGAGSGDVDRLKVGGGWVGWPVWVACVVFLHGGQGEFLCVFLLPVMMLNRSMFARPGLVGVMLY